MSHFQQTLTRQNIFGSDIQQTKNEHYTNNAHLIKLEPNYLLSLEDKLWMLNNS